MIRLESSQKRHFALLPTRLGTTDKRKGWCWLGFYFEESFTLLKRNDVIIKVTRRK